MMGGQHLSLGVAGLLGEATAQEVRRVRKFGFGTVSWHVPSWEAASDDRRLREVRARLEGEGMRLAQVLPPDYPSLVGGTPARRREGAGRLRAFVRTAAALGAGSAYVRPGSLDARGAWRPHRGNRSIETREQLVRSLQEVVPAAESAGVRLALEAHVLSPVWSAAVAREVLDGVDSPALGFNADPVNLIERWEDAQSPAAVVDEMFRLLGDRLVCAHLKDVRMGDTFVFHVEECTPGEGNLDIAAFLHRYREAMPAGVVLIEHLPAGRARLARRNVLRLAQAAGVPIT